MAKLYSIVFSPTGTSQFAADKIADAFDSQPISVDLCEDICEEIQIDSQSVCIFSVPCYGGRIPPTAAERLSHIRSSGARAIVCVTFGTRGVEDALLALAVCVEANGFRVVGGAAVVGEHNIMHVYGAGRPDALDRQELAQFSAAAAQKIKDGTTDRPEIPGSRPYKEYRPAKMEILVEESFCTHCGQCALRCPVKAVSADGSRTERDLCINCMRCIKICPQQCRSLPVQLVSGLMRRVGEACRERKMNQFYL